MSHLSHALSFGAGAAASVICLWLHSWLTTRETAASQPPTSAELQKPKKLIREELPKPRSSEDSVQGNDSNAIAQADPVCTDESRRHFRRKLEREEAALKQQDGGINQNRLERKLAKLLLSVQEHISWQSTGVEVLGLLPRLWIEVLDPHHHYGALLYGYWNRWELSDTEENFFDWLNSGPGSLVDLPKYPRRLLEESRIIYLSHSQQRLFEVRITPEGRFVWAVDGTPVSLPPLKDSPATDREREVQQLIEPRFELARRRDRMLEDAREAVERARKAGEEVTYERSIAIAKPLIEEGLLRQLRDPFFLHRLDADHRSRRKTLRPVSWTTPEPQSNNRRSMHEEEELIVGDTHRRLRLPEVLLPNLTWDDFLCAIDHEEGKAMDRPFPKADARVSREGIFVVDKFGVLQCSSKIRGVLQHSSFVRGHCVKVAGGITIVEGKLQKLSPHSGHYQPMLQTFEEMKAQWTLRGVSFEGVTVEPFIKL